MELTAAIQALKGFEKKNTITLVTDSKYVKMAFNLDRKLENKWMENCFKKPVKNKDYG